MNPFNAALHVVLDLESGFANHRLDPGGKTKFGITEKLARTYGYDGPMRELPRSTARSIYRQHFWTHMGLDTVAEITRSHALSTELFEAGVNCGRRRPIEWLQEWLNRLNRDGSIYDDIAVDGRYGSETAAALAAYIDARQDQGGVDVLRRCIDAAQATYYGALCDQEPGRYETFVFGWVRERLGENLQ